GDLPRCRRELGFGRLLAGHDDFDRDVGLDPLGEASNQAQPGVASWIARIETRGEEPHTRSLEKRSSLDRSLRPPSVNRKSDARKGRADLSKGDSDGRRG